MPQGRGGQLFWFGGPLCGSGGWRRAAPFKMIAFIPTLHFRKGINCTIKINKYKLNKIVAVLFNLFIVLISYHL
jgi:hypothetical protein